MFIKSAVAAKKGRRLTVKKNFSLKTDGFIGRLMQPASDRYPGKALIVMGGSDGVFFLTKLMAGHFVKHGITVLSLNYFGKTGLPIPRECYDLPVEAVERAAAWLYANDYREVGVWGFSEGAELALLSASLIESISCVIAASPSAFVTMGISWRRGAHNVQRSSFTWRGKPLPYLENRENDAKSIKAISKEKGEFYTRRCYEAGLEAGFPEGAEIAVEKIRGSILLISGGRDSNIPADVFCERIKERLRKHGFSYRILHLHYNDASHFLFPNQTSLGKLMSYTERKYAASCRFAREDSYKRTMEFLQQW